MRKRGETILNFVLMIGLLIVGTIIISNLQKVTVWQAREAESDFVDTFLETIKTTIERAVSYPSDAEYLITVPFAEPYELNISRHELTIHFTELGITKKKAFFTTHINIIPSRVENAGKIRVRLKDGNLMVYQHKECNVGDGICDLGCILEKICDSDCLPYADGLCNPYCVDINGDGNTDYQDSDGICDIDCARLDGICDPDCKTYEEDNCCGDDNYWTGTDCRPYEGNGVCEIFAGENCRDSVDCRCDECCFNCDGTDGRGCCPEGQVICNDNCITLPDEFGEEGDPCDCDTQCDFDLLCVGDDTKACCPSGMQWDGTQCFDVLR